VIADRAHRPLVTAAPAVGALAPHRPFERAGRR